MAIRTRMNGPEIDRVLRIILDAANEENDGKVLYIRRGELAFEDGTMLFNVTELA